MGYEIIEKVVIDVAVGYDELTLHYRDEILEIPGYVTWIQMLTAKSSHLTEGTHAYEVPEDWHVLSLRSGI